MSLEIAQKYHCREDDADNEDAPVLVKMLGKLISVQSWQEHDALFDIYPLLNANATYRKITELTDPAGKSPLQECYGIFIN